MVDRDLGTYTYSQVTGKARESPSLAFLFADSDFFAYEVLWAMVPHWKRCVMYLVAKRQFELEGPVLSRVAQCFRVSSDFLLREGSHEVYKGEHEGESVYLCLYRHPQLYSWCGYIISKDVSKFRECDVHGGWTFEAESIPEWMWGGDLSFEAQNMKALGFDCAHYQDLLWMGGIEVLRDGIYRSKAYVLEQLEAVLEQAKEM